MIIAVWFGHLGTLYLPIGLSDPTIAGCRAEMVIAHEMAPGVDITGWDGDELILSRGKKPDAYLCVAGAGARGFRFYPNGESRNVFDR